MKSEPLEIKVAIQIQKPVHMVFDAIVDPAKMSGYFIADGSAIMESEKNLIWHFPEFSADVAIRTGKIENDRYISFYWKDADGIELYAEITLTSVNTEETVVSIRETGHIMNDAGIIWLKGNTEGWTNFLACLKAYLEYKINLRKGAFEFLKVRSEAVI